MPELGNNRHAFQREPDFGATSVADMVPAVSSRECYSGCRKVPYMGTRVR